MLAVAGNADELAEWIDRPRGLPKLARVHNDSSERMAREAALAMSLKLPVANKMRASLDRSGLLAPSQPATPAAGAGPPKQ